MAAAPRGRARGETRERILVAALDLFVQRGFDGTSVSDIERAVGLAAGTGSFYRHFPTKEAVLVAAVEHGVEQMVAETFTARADLGETADPVERRRADLASRLREMERFRPVWSLVIAERERFPELARIFLSGLRMDVWDAGWSTDRAAAVAFAAIVGYSQLALLGNGPFRAVGPDEFVAAVTELLAPGEPPVA
jgi:AcrR family transcriptional regulator